MTFKQLIGKIHLYLGLASGILVFIVSLTGSIYVFREEIIMLLDKQFVHVESQHAPVMPPSKLRKICEARDSSRWAVALEYPGDNHPVIVYMEDSVENWTGNFLNPYSGELISAETPASFAFFDFVLAGHRWLWLPSYEVGHTIVSYATLIFIISLITGLVLWWPKNKAAAKQRFRFKWKTSTKWRRKNYDTHNVLGFYAFIVALILAITGVAIGIEWFHDGYYYIISGGDSLKDPGEIVSDTTQQHLVFDIPEDDYVWKKIVNENPGERIYIQFPNPKHIKDVIYASAGRNNYLFDQHTLEEIKVDHPMYGQFDPIPFSAKILRVNYDIHIGAIGGLPTKILAFLAGLVAASLPVTGFYIWWGRRNKKTSA